MQEALRHRSPSPQPPASPAEASPAARAAKPTIQSVDRSFDILEALSRSSGRMSLAELSVRVGLNLSTCHHLVATIARRGYISQDRATRQYSLGNRIFELSDARTRQIDLHDLAMPFLDRLRRETGEAIQLAVIEGADLVTIAKVASHHAVRVDSALSTANAAHATAVGKAILAWLPEGEIDAILHAKGQACFTPHTIPTRAALIEALRLVRRHGYAEDREEFQPNVYGAGAAIRSHKGTVVGALGVSLPMMRATADAMAATRRAVMDAAADLSRALGSRAAP